MAKENRREVFMVDAPEKFIAFQEARIAADAETNAIRSYSSALFYAIALYSAGESLERVRAQVKTAVSKLEKDTSGIKAKFQLQLPEEYFPAIWGLSLSILFGDASAEFAQRGAGQDSIFDQLLALTDASVAPSSKVLHPKPFQNLANVFTAEPNLVDGNIDVFLKNWYASMSQTPWHDTHLRQDPSFFGYWSFELAAIVKARSITDKKFSDNIFYPRDLVHQRLFRTWLEGQEGEADRQSKAALNYPEAMSELKDLLMGFIDAKSAIDKKGADPKQHMATLANLFGLSEDSLKDDPEKMRSVFLQLLKTMSKVSDEALKSAKDPNDPKSKKLLAQIQEMEAKLVKDSPAMQDLTKLMEDEGLEIKDLNTEERREAAINRLEVLGGAASKLVEDEEIGIEKLFEGLAGMMDDFSDIMGYSPRPKRDIEAEVGKELSASLDAANKKNMIQEDFDWSSIWRKDEPSN